MPSVLCVFFFLWLHLQFEGRKYCEHDFQMLFAPCCGFCGKSTVEVGRGEVGGTGSTVTT